MEEEHLQERVCSAVSPFSLPSALSSVCPFLTLLGLSFPLSAVILVLNFDETKPGAARGIYLFGSKCNIFGRYFGVTEKNARSAASLNPE